MEGRSATAVKAPGSKSSPVQTPDENESATFFNSHIPGTWHTGVQTMPTSDIVSGFKFQVLYPKSENKATPTLWLQNFTRVWIDFDRGPMQQAYAVW